MPEFLRTEIKEVILVKAKLHKDERGFFEERYKRTDFSESGISDEYVQLNHSFSRKGVIRGLHFQRSPEEQGKLVMTVSGAILDVAVDIRPWSSTFKRWVSVVLSRENGTSLWVPQGFAHGFLALEDSDVIYLTTKEYSPHLDCGVRWDDPDIGVKWPIVSPIISSKDRKLKSLKELIESGEVK
ncbi:MAG: dTDP-4-dehydrorhamnose 3,5-epimerase [Candidatus Thermoplasmatota archaeon]|jgi:dTDP-4-dehydrorhamnose 3,5-epimerase|nr:dTDP-4-dehydrorhamnose 3,5-epimerase [Candidatus Thermoplasmatota archaeon]